MILTSKYSGIRRVARPATVRVPIVRRVPTCSLNPRPRQTRFKTKRRTNPTSSSSSCRSPGETHDGSSAPSCLRRRKSFPCRTCRTSTSAPSSCNKDLERTSRSATEPGKIQSKDRTGSYLLLNTEDACAVSGFAGQLIWNVRSCTREMHRKDSTGTYLVLRALGLSVGNEDAVAVSIWW